MMIPALIAEYAQDAIAESNSYGQLATCLGIEDQELDETLMTVSRSVMTLLESTLKLNGAHKRAAVWMLIAMLNTEDLADPSLHLIYPLCEPHFRMNILMGLVHHRLCQFTNSDEWQTLRAGLMIENAPKPTIDLFDDLKEQMGV